MTQPRLPPILWEGWQVGQGGAISFQKDAAWDRLHADFAAEVAKKDQPRSLGFRIRLAVAQWLRRTADRMEPKR